MIDFKDWTDQQISAARTSLQAHADSQVGHPACRPETAALVWSRLEAGELTACFIRGYFLIYDVGSPWSHDELWLSELLLIKALPDGSFSDYVSGLRRLAAQHGCSLVETGNSVLRPGLRRLYEQAGFKPISESYYMEVAHGQTQEARQEG